jgi:hypothetical protein
MSDDTDLQAVADHGQPRPDMTVDESKYILSIDDAIERYKAAGIACAAAAHLTPTLPELRFESVQIPRDKGETTRVPFFVVVCANCNGFRIFLRAKSVRNEIHYAI